MAILVDFFFLSGHESEPTNRSLGRLSILEVEPLKLASLKSRWIPGCMCFKGLRCVNFYQMQPGELIYLLFSFSPGWCEAHRKGSQRLCELQLSATWIKTLMWLPRLAGSKSLLHRQKICPTCNDCNTVTHRIFRCFNWCWQDSVHQKYVAQVQCLSMFRITVWNIFKTDLINDITWFSLWTSVN